MIKNDYNTNKIMIEMVSLGAEYGLKVITIQVKIHDVLVH